MDRSSSRAASAARARLLRQTAAVGEAVPHIEPAPVHYDLGQQFVTEAEAIA